MRENGETEVQRLQRLLQNTGLSPEERAELEQELEKQQQEDEFVARQASSVSAEGSDSPTGRALRGISVIRTDRHRSGIKPDGQS